MSYCDALKTMPPEKQNLHKVYHDEHYGFPIHDDNELFCRLVLEINQAGLSWDTILKKQENFRKAYHNFELQLVSAYTAVDRQRLCQLMFEKVLVLIGKIAPILLENVS